MKIGLRNIAVNSLDQIVRENKASCITHMTPHRYYVKVTHRATGYVMHYTTARTEKDAQQEVDRLNTLFKNSRHLTHNPIAWYDDAY